MISYANNKWLGLYKGTVFPKEGCNRYGYRASSIKGLISFVHIFPKLKNLKQCWFQPCLVCYCNYNWKSPVISGNDNKEKKNWNSFLFLYFITLVLWFGTSFYIRNVTSFHRFLIPFFQHFLAWKPGLCAQYVYSQ